MLIIFSFFSIVTRVTCESYIDKARMALDSGKFAEAASMYDKAVDEDPKNSVAFFLRGSLNDALQKPQRALSDYTVTLQLSVDFHKARFKRALLLIKQAEFDNAIEDLNYIIGKEDSEFESVSRANLDKIYEIKEKLSNAKQLLSQKLYKEVFDILETFINDVSLSIEVRKIRCECMQFMDNTPALLHELSFLSQLNPNDMDLHKRLAVAHCSSGHMDEATLHVRKCLNYDPENSECKTLHKNFRKMKKTAENLEIKFENKKYKDALKESDILISESNQCSFYKNLGTSFKCRILQQLGDKDRAMEICSSLLRDSPDDVKARLARAELYMTLEEYEEAKSDYNEVLKLDDQNQQAQESLSKIDKILKNKNRKDYYKILNVSKSSTRQEIERSYRKMVKKYHPDKYRIPEEIKMANKKLQEINAAHSVLTDDEKRKLFDSGVDPLNPEQQSSGGHYTHNAPFDNHGSYFNYFRGGNFFGNGQGGGQQFRFNFG